MGTALAPACRWSTALGMCGSTDVRPFPCGWRCPEHSPWALTGTPEPLTPTEIAARKETA